MRYIILKRLTLLALLGSSLFMSGCAGNAPFAFLHDNPGNAENFEQLNSDDPALQLVESDTESNLDQELEALIQTGEWGDRGTVLINIDDPANPTPYDFPILLNKQVAAYLDLFQNKQRSSFQRWLSRSGRYRHIMEAELKKAGLPTDLVYLAMIESGYNQRAYSKAQAVGLWQFMNGTGKQYNLTINKYLDERCDAEKSTSSAVAFLNDLYQDFGDWHLAVAAYNAGPGKIHNGLSQHKVDNFWDLAKTDFLPLETKRYVPKLIAAIIIARQPEKFGFTDIAYDKPLKYDTIAVGPNLSLDAISIIAGTDTDMIKELNQELRTGKTPANAASYTVKIPAGSRELAARNKDRLHAIASTNYKTHVIRKGETLASICRRYDINTTTLLKVNNLRTAKTKPGTRLRIPFTTVKYQLLPEGSSTMLASYKENMILHRIKKGETLSAISRKYKVPAELVIAWNSLKDAKSLRAGQQLALFIEGGGKKEAPAKAESRNEQAVAQILASTTKIKKGDDSPSRTIPAEHLLAQNQAPSLAEQIAPPTLQPRTKRTTLEIPTPDDPYEWYEVRSGDSLWAISRKFKVSTKEIREWNNLPSDQLKPGSRLKMRKA